MRKVIGTISLCALCAIICSSLLAQGTKAGWPTAQLKEWGLNLKQPAGVKSSYTGNGDWFPAVYMSGANAKTLQELKQQIEKSLGGKMYSDQEGYSIGIRNKKCKIDNCNSYSLFLRLKGNLLEMDIEQTD